MEKLHGSNQKIGNTWDIPVMWLSGIKDCNLWWGREDEKRWEAMKGSSLLETKVADTGKSFFVFSQEPREELERI